MGEQHPARHPDARVGRLRDRLRDATDPRRRQVGLHPGPQGSTCDGARPDAADAAGGPAAAQVPAQHLHGADRRVVVHDRRGGRVHRGGPRVEHRAADTRRQHPDVRRVTVVGCRHDDHRRLRRLLPHQHATGRHRGRRPHDRRHRPHRHRVGDDRELVPLAQGPDRRRRRRGSVGALDAVDGPRQGRPATRSSSSSTASTRWPPSRPRCGCCWSPVRRSRPGQPEVGPYTIRTSSECAVHPDATVSVSGPVPHRSGAGGPR